eukprot:356238-Chlamydomonas_euryale.AAC.2
MGRQRPANVRPQLKRVRLAACADLSLSLSPSGAANTIGARPPRTMAGGHANCFRQKGGRPI